MLLHEITEHGEPVYELSSIVKSFPNAYRKVIEKMRGGDKLLYHDQPLFDADGGNGPALGDAVGDVKELIDRDEVKVEENMFIPDFEIDGEVIEGDNWEFDLPVKEGQHVWTAYDPKANALLLGYDAWVNEEDFNKEWDKFFEEKTGKEFDYDNDEHREVFDYAHKQFQKMGFYGLLFEYNPIDGPDLRYHSGNGFFKGTLNDPFVKNIGYIEL